MPKYRFLHAADLHLDSPFKGLFADAPRNAETLRRATFDVYDRIVSLCIEEELDALLIAGDIFDSSENSLAAQLKFHDGLNRLSEEGIQSFICHGNHDPLDGWQAGIEWPPEAHQFDSVATAVPLLTEDALSPLVYGISYPTRDVRENLVPRFPPRDPSRPAIGLMHANVGSNSEHASYAPCTIEDLVETGFDYWALGHVHTRGILRDQNPGHPVIVYPGNPQGRHPNESGERGAYLVEMDERGTVTDLQFHPLDVVRWETMDIPIEGVEDDQGLIETVEGEVRAQLDRSEGRDLVYGIRFTGRGEIRKSLRRAGYLADFKNQLNSKLGDARPFALCERIVDSSSVSVDRDVLMQGGDFIADLLNVIDEIRTDPSKLRLLAEDAQLDDLYGHARARRYIGESFPGERELLGLIDIAERHLIDGLVEGTE